MVDRADREDIIAPPVEKPAASPRTDQTGSPDEQRDWIVPPEQPFWHDLANAFLFFLEAENFVTFFFIVLFLSVPALLPLPLVGFGLGLLTSLYVCALFLTIIRETAAGEDRLPNLSSCSFWDDFLFPLVRFVGTWAMVLVPAMAAGWWGYNHDGVVPWTAVKTLAVIGLFFWPAVVLAVSIGGGFNGLWPHLVIRTAFAAPAAYLAVCAAVLLAAVIVLLPGSSLFQSLLQRIPGAPIMAIRVVANVLSAYAIVVAMKVIGLYYRHYRQKFPWVAE